MTNEGNHTEEAAAAATVSFLGRGTHIERSKESRASIEPYCVDHAQCTITVNDELLNLTPVDFDIAVLFLCNLGRLLRRSDICRSVWGPKAIKFRTLDKQVSRIRARLKLTEEHGWRLAAVYGHGYRLERVEIRSAAC